VTKLTVNGKSVDVDVDPETPLLWVLRDTLGLTGTKFGCGMPCAVPAPYTWAAMPSAPARFR
jgi:aerobic-type carbon monoxide dehydrogenase small subunit (CoxS/CutS family)